MGDLESLSQQPPNSPDVRGDEDSCRNVTSLLQNVDAMKASLSDPVLMVKRETRVETSNTISLGIFCYLRWFSDMAPNSLTPLPARGRLHVPSL